MEQFEGLAIPNETFIKNALKNNLLEQQTITFKTKETNINLSMNNFKEFIMKHANKEIQDKLKSENILFVGDFIFENVKQILFKTGKEILYSHTPEKEITNMTLFSQYDACMLQAVCENELEISASDEYNIKFTCYIINRTHDLLNGKYHNGSFVINSGIQEPIYLGNWFDMTTFTTCIKNKDMQLTQYYWNNNILKETSDKKYTYKKPFKLVPKADPEHIKVTIHDNNVLKIVKKFKKKWFKDGFILDDIVGVPETDKEPLCKMIIVKVSEMDDIKDHLRYYNCTNVSAEIVYKSFTEDELKMEKEEKIKVIEKLYELYKKLVNS